MTLAELRDMHHNRMIGSNGVPGEALLLHPLRRTQEGLLLPERPAGGH